MLASIVISVAVMTPGALGATTAEQWRTFLDDPTRHQPRSGYPYQHCFSASAQRYGLPEALLLAVGRGESALDPLARSHANAYGLMQIQWPGTAHHLGLHSIRELLNPCRNVDAGSRYLKELIARYDDLERALAAYNVGPGRVSTQSHKAIPDAGLRYSAYIYRQLRRDHRGAASAKTPNSPTQKSPSPRGSGRRYPLEVRLVVFDSPVRAHSLAHALSRRHPQVDIDAARLDARRFAVTVTMADEAAYRRGREVLRGAGFDLP